MKNNGFAFPVWELNGDGQQEMTDFGMTLRDYFAAQVLSGFVSDPTVREIEKNASLIAKSCYVMADAMIAARDNDY